jgi:hypothetical protein
MYGIAHCLIDRDGRVIGCNLPIGNGPLLEQAPGIAQIVRELVAGVSAEQLRTRLSSARVDRCRAGASRARMTSNLRYADMLDERMRIFRFSKSLRDRDNFDQQPIGRMHSNFLLDFPQPGH